MHTMQFTHIHMWGGMSVATEASGNVDVAVLNTHSAVQCRAVQSSQHRRSEQIDEV